LNEIVLQVSNLDVSYQLSGKRVLKAVQNATFELRRGETIGIVGESGCGKSSLVKAIAYLPKPSSGQVTLNGVNLGELNSRNLRESRKSFPIVFQDPISSLNPRRTVLQLVAQPLKIQKIGNAKERTEIATKMLEKVGISAELHGRRPYELSGGQCQRVSIARALVTGPSILICDEPVSALDVSVQAQILNLLEDLKEEFQLSILFVSHDLGVVKSISDRVMVMYLGKVVELADADEIYGNPQHPYTKLLLESVPGSSKGRVRPVQGVGIDLPSPLNPPSGCAFSSRCAFVLEHCRVEEPKLQLVDIRHQVSCHLTAKTVSAKA
jgi:peptide/nickel transport system ATP-binding protein